MWHAWNISSHSGTTEIFLASLRWLEHFLPVWHASIISDHFDMARIFFNTIYPPKHFQSQYSWSNIFYPIQWYIFFQRQKNKQQKDLLALIILQKCKANSLVKVGDWSGMVWMVVVWYHHTTCDMNKAEHSIMVFGSHDQQELP